MLADAAIRRNSNGMKSLDDLMRDLVEESRRTRKRFDAETLLRRIEDMAGDKEGAAIRAIVLDGATPEIDARIYEPCLQLQTVDIGPWDLGFDFTATRHQGQLVGVYPESRAYAAGLRDGQKIRGWSVHIGDPSREVELTLEEAGTQRKVRYLPQGKPTPTPQFNELPGATQEDCRCL
jgi:predicted metalloprotease with PDZ domain